LALAPNTIKAGFRATGICPFDPDIFSDADYVHAVERNVEEVAFDRDVGEEEQHRIISSAPNADSEVAPATSTEASSSALLDEIGPLQPGPSKQPSKRGRKPMSSTILTSPANIAALKEKATKRPAKKSDGVTQPAKRVRKPKPKLKPEVAPSSDDDLDFCVICLKLMPLMLTAKNCVKCIECQRPVHSRCVKSSTAIFKCKHCMPTADFDED